jgi:hypothetical protein
MVSTMTSILTSISASIGALVLSVTLVSPVQAQSGPPGITVTKEPAAVAATKEAAGALQLSLDRIAKTGRRPDYSVPPLADQFNRAFDVKVLATLPPVQGGDLPWLMDWGDAANGAFKSIQFFGIAPPVTLLTDAAELQRNAADYEDQEATAADFMLRFLARETQAAAAFSDELAPAARTPVRMEGFYKMRVALAETLRSDLIWTTAMKPANARLISAAVRDTGAVWATAILPADRPAIAAALAQAEAAARDDESRNNLAAFEALLTNAK